MYMYLQVENINFLPKLYKNEKTNKK